RLRLLRRGGAPARAATARAPRPPARARARAALTQPLNVWDYERLAEERLGPGAWSYFAGGADDERTLRWNLEAYGRWQLRPRILSDVTRVSTETTVLGTQVSLPVLVAPVAFQWGVARRRR